MRHIIRHTSSVCPICLKKLPAVWEQEEGQGGVFLCRTCPEHGKYSVPVWRGRLDMDSWIKREEPLSAAESHHCSGDCRSCSSHRQGSCCVLLEVTKQCDLHCRFCFAHGGESFVQPTKEALFRSIDKIVELAGSPLLQFSGGEPTLRDDLPELVAYAKRAGCPYTQVNTNGLRLAKEEGYVERLAKAGLDIVFLQFDGTTDQIYRKLRGSDLLEKKLAAIQNCDRHKIGVTLVPTVVRGVNEQALGDIVRFAVDHHPTVRSVHFQPVTYLGRYPKAVLWEERYTLDELISDLCMQTGIATSTFLPSCCDHALCESYATFLLNDRRQLTAVTDRANDMRQDRSSVQKNRAYVARHWRRADPLPQETPLPPSGRRLVADRMEEMDLDTFIRRMKSHSFTLSAMAFQDAMGLDLERLYRCSLHVYEDGKLLPFCARYLTPIAPEGA